MSRKAQFMKRKPLFMPQANSFLNIFTINNGLPYPNRGNQQQFPRRAFADSCQFFSERSDNKYEDFRKAKINIHYSLLSFIYYLFI